jgi:hypothetical protein
MRLFLSKGCGRVPETFSLLMVGSGVIWRVRRVWARKLMVGVELVASQELITSRTQDLYDNFMRHIPAFESDKTVVLPFAL